jgi:hypothetical protein
MVPDTFLKKMREGYPLEFKKAIVEHYSELKSQGNKKAIQLSVLQFWPGLALEQRKQKCKLLSRWVRKFSEPMTK